MADSSRIGKPFGPRPRGPGDSDGPSDLSKTGRHPALGPIGASESTGAAQPGVSQPLWDRVLGSDVHKLLRPAGAADSTGLGLPGTFVTELRGALTGLLSAPASELRAALSALPGGARPGPGSTGAPSNAAAADATPAQKHITWSLQRETLWTSMGMSFSVQGGRLVITMYSYGAGGVVVGYVVDEVIDLVQRGKVDLAARAWEKLGPDFFRHEDVPRIVGHVLRRTVVEGHRAFGAFVSRLETWLDSLLPQGAGDDSDGPALSPEVLQPWLDEFESLMRQHPEDMLHMAHLAQQFLEVAARGRD